MIQQECRCGWNLVVLDVTEESKIVGIFQTKVIVGEGCLIMDESPLHTRQSEKNGGSLQWAIVVG